MHFKSDGNCKVRFRSNEEGFEGCAVASDFVSSRADPLSDLETRSWQLHGTCSLRANRAHAGMSRPDCEVTPQQLWRHRVARRESAAQLLGPGSARRPPPGWWGDGPGQPDGRPPAGGVMARVSPTAAPRLVG
ncbi:hypothetical protein VULLAG_LOCUS1734 [Vulpes lagopus]